MKKFLSVRKDADGFLKKYTMRYDIGDGKTYDWEMASPREIKSPADIAKKPTAIELIGRFENGDFLLIREFRYPINAYCYSFPTGMIDPGEAPEEAARRELFEETGLDLVRIDRILPAGWFAVGLSDELMLPMHVTVAGKPHFEASDPVEDILPLRLTETEVRDLLKEEGLSITLSAMLVLTTLLG